MQNIVNRDINESEMFNQMADYYDDYRPNYPIEVINTIIEKSNLTIDSKLLEIGCGSGKATAQFANKGFHILGIDPGADLISKATTRFNDDKIKFIASRFESCALPENHFDTIISAQAFHWLLRPACYQLCAKVLKRNGWLMPFWNIEIVDENAMDREFYAIIQKYNACTAIMKRDDYKKRVDTITDEISQTGLFSIPQVTRIYWEKLYTPEEYYGFCMTGQIFVQNSNDIKRLCYRALEDYSKKYNGIKRNYVCELYATQKLL